MLVCFVPRDPDSIKGFGLIQAIYQPGRDSDLDTQVYTGNFQHPKKTLHLKSPPVINDANTRKELLKSFVSYISALARGIDARCWLIAIHGLQINSQSSTEDCDQYNYRYLKKVGTYYV